MMGIVDDNLFLARPIPNGFTFTLASRLGQMLSMCEKEFGPRDQSFTILGVEFREGVPQVWFPGNCGQVVVQLGREAMQEPVRALYQLAHECVHLLDPHPGGGNVLEEGTAVRFAQQYLASVGRSMRTGDKRYDDASQLVGQLLTVRGDAVKELRRLHGSLAKIIAEQIGSICPELDGLIRQALVRSF